MKILYKEVMLANISYQNISNIKFEFYDSSSGKDILPVICAGVLLFNYSSTLMPNEDNFPYFVLDVSEGVILPQNITQMLNKNKFGFIIPDENLKILQSSNYSIFKIQGGSINVTVICHEILKG